MATLRRFLLHSSLPTPPECHLFYAVSPSAQLDEFIVRFLPQHRTKVEQVILHLVKKLPGIQVGSTTPSSLPSPPPRPIVTPSPRPHQPKPASDLQPTVAAQQKVLDKVFKQRFTKAIDNPPSTPKDSFNCKDPRQQSFPAISSTYKLNQWLQALQQLLQNTAWDKWGYLIGILPDLRDLITLAPCNVKQSTN